LFFIDDREENVRCARAMECRRINSVSEPDLIDALRAAGVEF
jgi:hypothetical protein